MFLLSLHILVSYLMPLNTEVDTWPNLAATAKIIMTNLLGHSELSKMYAHEPRQAKQKPLRVFFQQILDQITIYLIRES